MKLYTRTLNVTEKILLEIDKASKNPDLRIDYLELTSEEFDKIYADVTSGAVKFDGQFYNALASKKSVLGVPIRIVEEVIEVKKRGK